MFNSCSCNKCANIPEDLYRLSDYESVCRATKDRDVFIGFVFLGRVSLVFAVSTKLFLATLPWLAAYVHWRDFSKTLASTAQNQEGK